MLTIARLLLHNSLKATRTEHIRVLVSSSSSFPSFYLILVHFVLDFIGIFLVLLWFFVISRKDRLHIKCNSTNVFIIAYLEDSSKEIEN